MCRIIVETGSDPARFLIGERKWLFRKKLEIDIAKGGKNGYSIYKEFRKYSK